MRVQGRAEASEQGAQRERMAGYEGLQANLSAVMREVEELSPERDHRQRLTETLASMHAQIQRLRDGASGEPRHQIELALEEEGTRLLTSLRVMTAGQRGEGCGLFGILEVPRLG